MELSDFSTTRRPGDVEVIPGVYRSARLMPTSDEYPLAIYCLIYSIDPHLVVTANTATHFYWVGAYGPDPFTVYTDAELKTDFPVRILRQAPPTWVFKDGLRLASPDQAVADLERLHHDQDHVFDIVDEFKELGYDTESGLSRGWRDDYARS